MSRRFLLLSFRYGGTFPEPQDSRPPAIKIVAPMSEFQHGEIWCERRPVWRSAARVSGSHHGWKLLDLARAPVLLPASTTCDWQGDRLVLVAFAVGPALSLPPEVRDPLDQLGFTLPCTIDELKHRFLYDLC